MAKLLPGQLGRPDAEEEKIAKPQPGHNENSEKTDE